MQRANNPHDDRHSPLRPLLISNSKIPHLPQCEGTKGTMGCKDSHMRDCKLHNISRIAGTSMGDKDKISFSPRVTTNARNMEETRAMMGVSRTHSATRKPVWLVIDDSVHPQRGVSSDHYYKYSITNPDYFVHDPETRLSTAEYVIAAPITTNDAPTSFRKMPGSFLFDRTLAKTSHRRLEPQNTDINNAIAI